LSSLDYFIPLDIRKFLFDYSHSKFIECNRDQAKKSAEYMKQKSFENNNLTQPAKFGIIYVKSVLEKFEKNYWLAAGTLLGWYRGK
jgi:hypothetical protein